MVADLGARRHVVDAVAHDRIVAMISHVPHFLAGPVLEASAELDDDRVWQLAAGGFRAVTEAAADNVPMWRDIALTNPGPVAGHLRAVADRIVAFAAQLEAGDEAAISATLRDAAALYEQNLS